jgi:predicted acyltransferase
MLILFYTLNRIIFLTEPFKQYMNQRFYSLDVFRGATVALMILVNNPGSWGHIFPPLKHAGWHGCTPTDLVFPFFLFAVGNALAFVMPKLEANHIFWQKVLKRTLLIFLIGLFLNWFPFIKYNDNGNLVAKPFETLRIFGVLQRIALSYFFASLIIHFFKVRGAFVAAAFLLLLYWFVCIAANPADPYSLLGWFGRTLEIKWLGENHMYHGEGVAFDPEGPLSTLAAIVQVIFGYLVGHYILTKGKTAEMLNGLFVAGAVLVFTGFIWDTVFPINKKIWTSSYTVYTTGLALMVLAVLIYLIEFKNAKGAWSRFFDVFGKNALFIFALSGILPRLLALIRINNGLSPEAKPQYLTPLSWFYEHLCKPLLPYDPRIGSLLYALCFIAMMWFFAWWMHKKKIYIKV